MVSDSMNERLRLLLVGEPSVRLEGYRMILEADEYDVSSFPTVDWAISDLQRQPADVVLLAEPAAEDSRRALEAIQALDLRPALLEMHFAGQDGYHMRQIYPDDLGLGEREPIPAAV